MNHYSWKSTDGQKGEIYAGNASEVIEKVESEFSITVQRIFLLEDNIKINHSIEKK